MRETHMRILCSVIRVDMVYESPEGMLVPFFDSTDTSPLMHSQPLRDLIKSHTLAQSAPYLHQGAEDCYFAGLRAGEGILYMGPMCHQKLKVTGVQRMYRYYNIESNDLRDMRVYSMPEMRNMMLLANSMLDNANLENEELLQLNRLINQADRQTSEEIESFRLKEDEKDDEALYRHTYQEEQMVVKAVMEGNAEEAIRISESMDQDSGRLGTSELSHRRITAIIAITICSRAAIHAGISPHDAYRLSGFYIQKCDMAQDPAHLLHYRNRAIQEMAGRVKEKIEKQRSSSYVERCKDYVRKNYRQKIYIEDIAEALGISTSYLSRLFHAETGERLQDHINTVRIDRAANMLLYSDKSLSEIAEYIGFPNQSYFGKIFLKYKGITPRKYRDIYRSTEFEEK